MKLPEPFLAHLEREVDGAHRDLQRKASDIAHDMDMLKRRLEQGPVNVNSLGELQARGPQFDVACARYAHARQVLADFQKFGNA